jgi:hypothetical protein
VERQNVVSREYKIMLRPKLFKGDPDKLLAHAASLWKDLCRTLEDVVIRSAGGLSEIKTRRLIRFLDTRDRDLNHADYIFRERHDLDETTREMTLKFRHPDRFLAQARNMKPAAAAKAKTKFEEDIKSPFVSLYSFSTTIGVADDVRWPALKDLIKQFPDLDKRLGDIDRAERLQTVSDFTARELVLHGATVQIGRTPDVEAEWALIVWYDDGGNHRAPAAVELSYRYGDKNENYAGGPARRASDIFALLQSDLERWVDPNPRTKTAFVFS